MTYFPQICIYSALAILAAKTINIIKDKNISTPTLVIFFSSIGLCLSLASVCFTYARGSNDDDKKNIITAGEHFLSATLSFIYALLLAWIGAYIQELRETYIFIDTADTILAFSANTSILLSSVNSGFAAMRSSKGLFNLNKELS